MREEQAISIPSPNLIVQLLLFTTIEVTILEHRVGIGRALRPSAHALKSALTA